MTAKIRKIVQLGILSVLILTAYNNCSKGFETAESSLAQSAQSLSSGGGICEDSLIGLFGRGYYPFVRSNCITCHATDVDKPQFANPDINAAYRVFMSKGYTKVSDNAISANHNPPYSGPQNTVTINELRLQWQQGLTEYNQCKGITTVAEVVDPAQLLSLETSQKLIPPLAVDMSQTVVWSMGSDLHVIKAGGVVPNLPGANFSIRITRHQTGGGEDYYVFSDPTIYGATVDIHVKTMYIKINSRLMTFPTTFKFVDSSIRAGSMQDISGLISTGGLTTPGAISNQDMLSVAFEKVEATTLPPPAIPVQVNFNGAKVLIVDSSSGSLNLGLTVSKAVQDPVTLTVEDDGSALCGSADPNAEVVPSASCLPEVFAAMQAGGLADAANLKVANARSLVGNNGLNRYDWDYKMNLNAMTFSVGQATSQSFAVAISTDVRHETNRLLRLKLNIASKSAVTGTQGNLFILVRKISNPVPANGEITYSKLVKTVFTDYCLTCHNSTDFKGNYDITNYQLMIANRVVVPFSTTSKMIERINANDPNFDSLKGMPGKRGLDQPQIDIITQWILSGAKNN